jgi:glycosyltransferase involved in cell wall biosynthesis
MLIFVFQLLIPSKKLQGSYDVVVASCPPPLIIYSAYYLARRNKARLVYDIRDLWPLTLKELGGHSASHPFIWLMQKAENFACRNADLVTSVPHNSEAYLKSKGLGENKFLALGNGYLQDEPLDTPPQLSSDAIERLNVIRAEAALVVCYAGALGLANALGTLIKAVVDVPGVHVLLLGDGPEKEALLDLSDQLKVQDRVHFLGRIPPQEVDLYFEFVDVAYIGLLKRELFKMGVSPTKLNTYMGAKKPIIYAIGDPDNNVEQSQGGISCPPESPKSVQAVLEVFMSMSEAERKEMGNRGYEWLLANNTLDVQIKTFLQRLHAL